VQNSCQVTTLNYLGPRLAAISHKPPCLLFTGWLNWQLNSLSHQLLHITSLNWTPDNSTNSLSKLLYDWRFTANQFISPLRLTTSNFIFQLNICDYSPYVTTSLTRMGLSFTIPAGPGQRSHSEVWVPRDSCPNFTVSDSRHPQPGVSDLPIYIPQEQGGPVIPPGTVFPFFFSSCDSKGYGGDIRLRLHTGWPLLAPVILLITPFAWTEYKTPFPKIPQFLHANLLPQERVYQTVV
jgi:hypothetical protein